MENLMNEVEDSCDDSLKLSKILGVGTSKNESLQCQESDNEPLQPIANQDQHNMVAFEGISEVTVDCADNGETEQKQFNFKETEEDILKEDSEIDVSTPEGIYQSLPGNNVKPQTITRRTFYHDIDSESQLINVNNGKLILEPKNKTKLNAIYTCNCCSCTFRIKSLYLAHKNLHAEGSALVKRQDAGGAISKVNGNQFKCQYCDKKFVLERTFHIHLMQNCIKIPPNVQRKLDVTKLITDDNGQESRVHNESSKDVTKCKTPISKLKPYNDSPHTGIYRKPKPVPCHICNQTFMNFIDFYTHSSKVHASRQCDDIEQCKDVLSLARQTF